MYATMLLYDVNTCTHKNKKHFNNDLIFYSVVSTTSLSSRIFIVTNINKYECPLCLLV